MSSITYSLKPVSEEFTGSAKVYRAVVQTNGTIDPDQLASDLAEKTRQDKSLIQYILSALNEELKRQILGGYRVNLGELTTGFAIKGAFISQDDKFDPERHTLVPTIRALDPLKSALNKVGAENITLGLSCSLNSLMDFVTKELNCITGTDEVHIQGVNLGINTENPDEFVHLLGDDGTVVAVAEVSASDTQTITCRFTTPPSAGVYTLVVSARNGARESLAPAVAKLKNITVKAAE